MADRAEKCADILNALKSYRCSETLDGEGDGLPLVDKLTPEGDRDISRGNAEMEALAEHIRSHYPDDRELLNAATAAANKFLKHSGSCCVQHPTTHEFSVTPESCKCDPIIKRLRTAIERRS